MLSALLYCMMHTWCHTPELAVRNILIACLLHWPLQDTWAVFVLVELLGSHLVTPGWSNPVQLPSNSSSGISSAATVCMADNEPDSQTASASSPITTATSYSAATASASTSSNVFCSWSNGYVYSNSDDNPSSSTAAAAASTKLSAASLSMAMHTGLAGQQGSTAANFTAAAAAAGGSVGPGGRCRAGVPVDVLSYGISYPQFVEVLLCMMAGRATALLEPEVKQLRQLSMDEEMQVSSLLDICFVLLLWCWGEGMRQGCVGAVACYGT
jgi:hypothetical protein